MFGKVPLDGNSLGIYPIQKLVIAGVSCRVLPSIKQNERE
jgi:hypothetical protein